MIKIILVPIDGLTERSVEVLNNALIVANRFGSHIKAVHVRKHTRVPFMFNGMPSNYRNEFIEMSDNAMKEVMNKAKQQFNDFCTQAGIEKTNGLTASSSVTASLQIFDGDAESVLAHEARLVDLIAMPRPTKDSIDGPHIGELHESLMLHSGRPLMIVPPTPEWQPHKVDHAAVGWNDSVEASRTLSMTLPWLVQVKKVSVLVSKQREANVDEVIDYLKQHGCNVDYHVISGKGTSAGSTMLTTCAEIGAEFLVVGGCSHTHTRELLFGGVTRHLLSNTNIITVMAH